MNDYAKEALENTVEKITVPTEFEKALKEMYDLGYTHGKAMMLKEIRLAELEKELERLNG